MIKCQLVKNCIHFKICCDFFKWSCNLKECANCAQRCSLVGCKCEDFKDKSKIIELPCALGTTIYIVGTKYREGKKETYINTGSFRAADIDKIGTRVFLTLEAAEKHIKELKNESKTNN